MLYKTLVAVAISFMFSQSADAQCTGILFEEEVPPVVLGMSINDPGFSIRYWSWDQFNECRSGVDQPVVADISGGIRLIEVDWAQAGVCTIGGQIERTVVLFEALGPEGFGRWALLNLAVEQDGLVDIDYIQAIMGQVSSRAGAVPQPSITNIRVDTDAVEVHLSWKLDHNPERLSDLVPVNGGSLSSVRGYALYVINGPAATARPWDWSRVDDLQSDAVNGFSTNTEARIRLPRSLWNDVTVSFALALTFDGDGDAEGEQPQSRSVHGNYLGVPSRWIHLPSLGGDEIAGFADLHGVVLDRRSLGLQWTAIEEPEGVVYRLWYVASSDSQRVLAIVPGGQQHYSELVNLAEWCETRNFGLRLEMRDAYGRVIAEQALKYESLFPIRTDSNGHANRLAGSEEVGADRP